MSLTCTHCEGGFLNLSQAPDCVAEAEEDTVLNWIKSNSDHDVQVCDCCGDGKGWYGVPGEHYNSDDPPGDHGPYTYNGGLCECH